MLTADRQDQFIELRSQGWSLGHIATEIHVSKRTLVDWNREFASQIQAFRKATLKLLEEKTVASREEELDLLLRLQKDVQDELANRPLRHVPVDKLFRLAVDLRSQINEMTKEKPAQQP